MKTTLLPFALCLAFILPLCAQTDGKERPELQPLAQFIGEWSYEGTYFKSEWTPEDQRITGTTTGAWTLDGNFLEEKGGNATVGTSSRKLYTYDSQARTYRVWWFSSTSQFNDATGDWDAATRTFTWTTKLANGITGLTTQRFIDERTLEWKIVFKDAAGKIYFHTEGRAQRK